MIEFCPNWPSRQYSQPTEEGSMNIELVLKGVELGRYGRERLEHKLAKTADRLGRDVSVRVVLEEDKGLRQARVMTNFNGREILGHASSRSVLEALDEAVVKFDRQFSKLTDRSSRRGRARRNRGGLAPTNGAAESFEGEAFEGDEFEASFMAF